MSYGGKRELTAASPQKASKQRTEPPIGRAPFTTSEKKHIRKELDASSAKFNACPLEAGDHGTFIQNTGIVISVVDEAFEAGRRLGDEKVFEAFKDTFCRALPYLARITVHTRSNIAS